MPKPTISPILLDTASRVMDAYYQDFNSNDDFFRLEDFAWQIGVIYGKVADEIAQAIYQNSRAETGMGQITFSQDWWASKDFEVKQTNGEWNACLDIKYVGFTYDSQNSGIQLVRALKGDCQNLVRTTLTEIWQLDYITGTKTGFWYVNGTNISFEKNHPNFIRVFYIPTAQDENFKLPSSVEFDIANRAWTAMITYKKQTPVVDATNNLNANVTQQSETDLSTMQPVNQ